MTATPETGVLLEHLFRRQAGRIVAHLARLLGPARLDLAEEAGFQVTSPRDPARRGGTVTVAHPQASAITKELVRREFIVDYRPGAGVRISPHFYTTDEELHLAIEEMKRIRDTATFAGQEFVGAAF